MINGPAGPLKHRNGEGCALTRRGGPCNNRDRSPSWSVPGAVMRSCLVHTPWLVFVAAGVCLAGSAKQPAVDLGAVTEKHVMVPMRDEVKLSTYLYVPPGPGPWPVVYEQR